MQFIDVMKARTAFNDAMHIHDYPSYIVFGQSGDWQQGLNWQASCNPAPCAQEDAG